MPLLSRRLRALSRKHSKKTPYSITRVMAGYQRCISLALVCLLLCHDSLQVEQFKSTACTNEPRKDGADQTFIKTHVRTGTPTTLTDGGWGKFLEKGQEGNHKIHSFLTSTMDEVNAVCSRSGGKQYQSKYPSNPSTNLCISNDDFKFFTVTWVNKVPTIKEETKRLILACDQFVEKCLPTHFEPHGNTPVADNGKECGP
ncbi:unnamed protein product [Gadus morhua 'NCC']